jgi:hypothetical protein
MYRTLPYISAVVEKNEYRLLGDDLFSKTNKLNAFLKQCEIRSVFL